MALNLIKEGFEVRAFNRTAAKAQEVAHAGGKACASVAELVAASEVVITMLSNDDAVKEVVLGKGGVAASGKPGMLVIDSSTVSPITSKEMAAALAKRGVRHLDAPVAGSRKQAVEGSLSFLVGGDRAAFEACQPVFAAMGNRVLHLGATGAGATAKLCNNMMVAIHMAAFSEALALAERCGLAREKFVQIVGNSGAFSRMVEWKSPKILSDNFNPDFALALMNKDVNLARQLGEQVTHPMPVLDAVRDVFGKALQEVDPDADFSAIYQWYRPRPGK
jgi:3-hydroxyisobutyrate dehydrogenase